MKKIIRIIFLFVLFYFCNLFAQNYTSSITLISQPDNSDFNPDTTGQVVILTEGNYTCGEFGNNDLLYVIRNDTLFTLDINTLNETIIDLITGINSGQNITGITYSYYSNIMYLGTTSISISDFYTLDLNTAEATFVGQVGLPGLTGIEVDCSEIVYGFDLVSDQLLQINPATGAGTYIGPLGFNANYQFHSEFDLSSSTLFIAAFNDATFSTQIRTVDLTTGNSTLISDLGGIFVTVFAIEGDCGPGKAFNPAPEDSLTDVPVNLPELTWENPAGSISNEVWFGTDSSNLISLLSGDLFTSYAFPDSLEYDQTYFWRIDENGVNGSSQGKTWRFTTEETPVTVEHNSEILYGFSLFQNYPNPFNPTTKIKFTIPLTDTPLPGVESGGFVSLKVFDVLGNEIATLVNEEKPAGEYEVEFNNVGTSRDLSLPSGIYFYQLKAGNYIQTKKMVLTK